MSAGVKSVVIDGGIGIFRMGTCIKVNCYKVRAFLTGNHYHIVDCKLSYKPTLSPDVALPYIGLLISLSTVTHLKHMFMTPSDTILLVHTNRLYGDNFTKYFKIFLTISSVAKLVNK